jgi:regulator of ribonuclease activity A
MTHKEVEANMQESEPVTDICDEFPDEISICNVVFADYGGVSAFSGEIVTLRTFEDNTKVRGILEEEGRGRVLVVDGGGSRSCALVGGNIAELAAQNGWSGIVVNGCIRDRSELMEAQIGIKAIGHTPKKSRRENRGEQNVVFAFSGVQFEPGNFLYADLDGIAVAKRRLK